MFSGRKRAHHECTKADQQQDYEKHLSVRTALISKLTSSSSRGVLTSPIRTSSTKSRSPTCNLPLRIRRSTGRSKSSESCARKHKFYCFLLHKSQKSFTVAGPPSVNL